jgi:Trk K+ transport system NAD-binding subunit
MHNILYLLLRRMRVPLIGVTLAYAISILGLVLMPGMDDQGNAWSMSFFHAFYFVSFMGSTIGFGEIPYPFSDAQRIWTTVAMYMTVISWLYAIGALFSIVQDKAFRRVVAYANFTREVRRIREPFYLVCGFGDAGQLLIRELAERGKRCVVVDKNETKIHSLQLEELRMRVPGLTADFTDSSALVAAGLRKPQCAGVIALTDNDDINLMVSITSKLLAPEVSVICRAESHDSQANIASFGTDYIINPYDRFAERFAMMFQSPSMYLVYEWMTSTHQAPLTEFAAPPKGTWIICGYGRFGKALQKSLSFEGIKTIIIELDTEGTNAPEGTIKGRGTEAITLHEAGIEYADGLIAGTDDDGNNLSIIMTALHLNKNLFTVARQNISSNDAIFAAADTDITMLPGRLIGKQIVDMLTTPLLTEFLRLTKMKNEKWANVLVSRVAGILTDRPPQSWAITISTKQSPAVTQLLRRGETVTVKDLLTDPRDITMPLPCVALYLLHQNHQEQLLPTDDMPLQIGDQLLICGQESAERHMRWSAGSPHALSYICSGYDRPSGSLWRWMLARRNKRASS